MQKIQRKIINLLVFYARTLRFAFCTLRLCLLGIFYHFERKIAMTKTYSRIIITN